jgi:hypothetical protein
VEHIPSELTRARQLLAAIDLLAHDRSLSPISALGRIRDELHDFYDSDPDDQS